MICSRVSAFAGYHQSMQPAHYMSALAALGTAILSTASFWTTTIGRDI